MAISQQTGALRANRGRIQPRSFRNAGVALVVASLASGCGSATEAAQTTTAPTAQPSTTTTTTTATTAGSSPTTRTSPQPTLPERPVWLGTRDLSPDDDSIATGLDTPPELLDRRFATIDVLAPPELDEGFVSSIEPLSSEILEASTWEAGCPVSPEDLRYLQLSFWGFDDRPHTGDMIVNADVADDVVSVFAELFETRFPIEEMRIITDADLIAPQSGDGNVTAAFVCRAARGSSRFSEHAYGLAIDINPFHNPYLRGEILLPELSRHYLPRDLGAPGQIVEGDIVTTAFDRIGWSWGGRWNSLLDYQHFSLNNR